MQNLSDIFFLLSHRKCWWLLLPLQKLGGSAEADLTRQHGGFDLSQQQLSAFHHLSSYPHPTMVTLVTILAWGVGMGGFSFNTAHMLGSWRRWTAPRSATYFRNPSQLSVDPSFSPRWPWMHNLSDIFFLLSHRKCWWLLLPLQKLGGSAEADLTRQHGGFDLSQQQLSAFLLSSIFPCRPTTFVPSK